MMSFFQFRKYLCQKVLGARRIDEDHAVTGLGAKQGVGGPDFAILLHLEVGLDNFIGFLFLAGGKSLHVEIGEVGRSKEGAFRQGLMKPAS